MKTDAQIKLEVELSDWERALTLSNQQFYNVLMNQRITALLKYQPFGVSWIDFVMGGAAPPKIAAYIKPNWQVRFEIDQELSLEYSIQDKRRLIPGKIAELKERWAEMKKGAVGTLSKVEKPKGLLDGLGFYRFLSKEKLEKKLGENAKRIEELVEELKAVPEVEAVVEGARKPQVRPKPKAKRKRGGGFAPSELRNMEFDTIDLPGEGELGTFLGDLEKNILAIALIGDPTAGKSTFSYRLAKVFLNTGRSVKYFALEEGVGRLASEKLIRADIADDDPFEIVGEGGLAEIRKAAKAWDVVMVDS
ncbi:MAG: hypothetical protein AAF570_04245 [Bacteroidota bacterium]